MFGYALRRLLGTMPTLLVIVTAAFFLMRLAPGGPFDEEQSLPPEIPANLEAAYGLDQPMLVQFGRYLGGLLHGDLGPSFKLQGLRRVRTDRAWSAGHPDDRCAAALLLAGDRARRAARHAGRPASQPRLAITS